MKKVLVLCLLVAFIFVMSACTFLQKNKDLNDKPFIVGTVVGISNTNIVIQNENGKFIVSTESSEDYLWNNFELDDVVKVYYDGILLETYPAQIHNVYDIQIVGHSVPID